MITINDVYKCPHNQTVVCSIYNCTDYDKKICGIYQTYKLNFNKGIK
jgi:hypothetical protein